MPTTKRTMRLEDDLWEEMKEAAEEENRSLTNLITHIMRRALERRKQGKVDWA